MKAQKRLPQRRQAKAIAALWLTFVAGFVDIVGFLTVYRLFTAHMTGTTVRIAEHLVHRDWHAAAIAERIVLAFLFGSILGRTLIEIGSRVGVRHIASLTLAIEAVLLIATIAFGGTHSWHSNPSSATATVPLFVMLATAMGLQTATLTGIGPLTIHTTFVTGMLNKLAQLVARMLFRTYDLHRASGGPSENEHRQKLKEHIRQASLISAIWVLYLVGAASGTWAAGHWQLRALYLPCCMLLLAIGMDRKWTLSIEEEREQASLKN